MRILIVDDEPGIVDICSRVATSLGYEVATASNGKQALALADSQRFDIVLADIRMPGCDGFELLRHLQADSPDTSVALMTGYASIDQAVDALKRGAQDYIHKPFDIKRLSATLTELAEWRQEKTAPDGEDAIFAGPAFHGIVGRSAPMQEVFHRVMRAARFDYTVFIHGESGTGKELVARAIHACSPRAEGPFLPLDCGALNESVIESELFGHVKGAFTDAREPSPGVLRAADGGTVFLDEIGEIPMSIQPKFLRALQEREVRPVGGTRTVPFDARLIAATNRDLEHDVAQGKFRKDLFYRLHVIPIYIAPLRRRREDIPLLVEAFCERCPNGSEEPITVSEECMDLLIHYDWPGNVRELESCIGAASVMKAGPSVELQDLPEAIRTGGRLREQVTAPGEPIKPLAEHEAAAIHDALTQTGNNKTQAAKALGISVPTLYAKIRKYGIELPP